LTVLICDEGHAEGVIFITLQLIFSGSYLTIIPCEYTRTFLGDAINRLIIMSGGSVLITVLCILIGIPLGFIFRNNTRVVSAVNRLTMWSIYALLFMLGVTTGSNKAIVTQLGTIGVQAACISVLCVLGSACAVFLLDTLFLKGKFDER